MKDEGIFSKSWIPGAMALPASAGKVKRITGAPPGYAYGSPAAAAGFGDDGLGAKVEGMLRPMHDPVIQRHADTIARVLRPVLTGSSPSSGANSSLRAIGTTRLILDSMRLGYGPSTGFSALRYMVVHHLLPVALVIFPQHKAYGMLSVFTQRNLQPFLDEATAILGVTSHRQQVHGYGSPAAAAGLGVEGLGAKVTNMAVRCPSPQTGDVCKDAFFAWACAHYPQHRVGKHMSVHVPSEAWWTYMERCDAAQRMHPSRHLIRSR